jgi:hypothetical protein
MADVLNSAMDGDRDAEVVCTAKNHANSPKWKVNASTAFPESHSSLQIVNIDRRPTLQYVAALEARVAELERKLRANTHASASSQGDSTLGEDRNAVGPALSHVTSSHSAKTGISGEQESSDGDSQTSVDELTDHLEGFTISSAGDLRFFGAASGLNLSGHYPGANDAVTASQAQIRSWDAAQLYGVTECPDELRDHLLGLYWRWQNSWQYMIPQYLFLQDLHITKTSRFCTPLLLSAMLALASRYSDRLEVRTDVNDPNTAGLTFFTAAQAMLQHELEAPKTSTIQATVLIGLYITATDKESTGWLYAGQASRMAFNLGLHLDCSKYVQQGLITPEDAFARNVTWWGVYVIDR